MRRFYRILLCAYPPDFRRRFGREMERASASTLGRLVNHNNSRRDRFYASSYSSRQRHGSDL